MTMSVSKQKHTNQGYIQILVRGSCAFFLSVFRDSPTQRTWLAPCVLHFSHVTDMLAFILLIPFPFYPELSGQQGLTYPAQDAPDTFTRWKTAISSRHPRCVHLSQPKRKSPQFLKWGIRTQLIPPSVTQGHLQEPHFAGWDGGTCLYGGGSFRALQTW